MLGGDGRKKNGGARAGAGRKAGLPNSSTLEFRNYVRQYTKEAVDMFVAAMRDEKMDRAIPRRSAVPAPTAPNWPSCSSASVMVTC
jgi:hypothetical protein